MRELLGRIDAVRREGAVRGDCGRVYRTRHGAHTLVAYADIAHADVVAVVEAEVAQARRVSGSLEWDVFGHDPRTELPEVLVGAGFVGEPKEQVLAAYATDRLLERWDAPRCEVRRVRDSAGIADIAKVSREVGRKNVEAESKHLAATLKDTRPTTWAYVARIDGEPVACGRLHFASSQPIAWLAGGRTSPAFRRRGLYIATVRRRIEDAIARGCVAVIVDALPTSEPILAKRGFEAISDKQAFVLAT